MADRTWNDIWSERAAHARGKTNPERQQQIKALTAELREHPDHPVQRDVSFNDLWLERAALVNGPKVLVTMTNGQRQQRIKELTQMLAEHPDRPKPKGELNRYWSERRKDEPVFLGGRNPPASGIVWHDKNGAVFYWTGQDTMNAHTALSKAQKATERGVVGYSAFLGEDDT